MVDGGVTFLICVDFQWILMKMGVWVHPQLGLLCGAALPGAFFLRKTALLTKKMILHDSLSIFIKIDIICY